MQPVVEERRKPGPFGMVVNHAAGEVRCALKTSADLRPGVAVLPKGMWSHHTSNGNTANALAPDTLSDLGGGACFNDARVQVERDF